MGNHQASGGQPSGNSFSPWIQLNIYYLILSTNLISNMGPVVIVCRYSKFASLFSARKGLKFSGAHTRCQYAKLSHIFYLHQNVLFESTFTPGQHKCQHIKFPPTYVTLTILQVAPPQKCQIKFPICNSHFSLHLHPA